MSAFICVTCGTQYPTSDAPPGRCSICEDERQFLPVGGQAWTTLDKLRQSHCNAFRRYEPGLLGIGTFPHFAIGQRALLVRTPAGNVLWDCISLLDDATVEIVNALGGLAAIAISHPHFYTTMVEWSRAFSAPVHLHAADRQWVMRPDDALAFWEGDTKPLLPGVTLIRAGGHFPGSTVLHWQDGAAGGGVLLSADIAQVARDRKSVSFLWSYPNMIPLPRSAVERIARRLAPFRFEAVYGIFWESVIPADGSAILAGSAERYIRAITGEGLAGEG
jgi:glyoxylase-like metal-dependent hydrolase (beta-lactamase superfamily II)